MSVALVACCKEKLPHAAPARELYRSPLFRFSLAYAERAADKVLILSAKLGVVDPDRVIEPYDLTLTEMPVAELRAWRARVGRQLADVLGPLDVVTMVAGRLYEPELRVAYVHRPLQGMGIGRRLQWLKARAAPRDPNTGRYVEP